MHLPVSREYRGTINVDKVTDLSVCYLSNILCYFGLGCNNITAQHTTVI